jgi:hypothetical protein
MSLNQINLNTNLLISLYGEVLIEPFHPKDTKSKPPFLGSASKGIGLLVHYPDHPYVDDQDLLFLTNIINACRLNMTDVALFNGARLEVPALQVFRELELKKVILFGPGPLQAGLPMNFPPYQIQQYDGCAYVLAPTLQELQQNVKEKGRLWTTLQQFFSLK